MKKILSIIFMSLLVCSMLLFVSCGPEEPTPCVEHTDTDGDLACDVCGAAVEPECSAHMDENADKLCDECGIEFFPRCTEHQDANKNSLCDVCGKDLPMNITFALKDQEGTAIAGVTVIVTDDEMEEYVFVTDSDGKGTLELYKGEYHVSYDTISEGVYFPEGYLPIPSTVNVYSDSKTVEIEILKTVPNGQIDRPFPIDENDTEIIIPASTTYHYVVYHSSGRNVVFEGKGFKLTYGDKVYNPDESDRIAFTLSEIEANENSHFIIENSGDEDVKIGFSIFADKGTFGNPFEITPDDNTLIADTSNGAVYYKYIASANGKLTLSTKQMLMFKTETMPEAKPLVKISGDEGAYNGVYELASGSVTYTITISDDSIVISDTTEGSASLNGTYSYTVNDDGEFELKDGETSLPVTLFKGGSTIVATCSSNSMQIVISGTIESSTIDVKEGEMVRILVNCEFADEMIFEIEFAEKTEE